jgi:hypothetical protein
MKFFLLTAVLAAASASAQEYHTTISGSEQVTEINFLDVGSHVQCNGPMRTNECPSHKILYECEDDVLMCCHWNHIGRKMNRAQREKLKEDVTLPEFGDCERVSSEEDGDSGYLRGSDMVSDFSFEEKSQSPCEKGESDGKRIVQDAYDGDCNNVVNKSFQSDVKRQKDRKFSRNKNWKDNAYNDCGKKAVDKELDAVGKECNNSGQAASDCNELGEEAAKAIVRENNKCGNFSSTSHSIKEFQKACRSVATTKCEGYIPDAVKGCQGKPLNLSQQQKLSKQCKKKVDSWTKSVFAVETE